MPTLRVSLDVQLDGQSLSGYPYTRSITSDVAQMLDTLIPSITQQPSLANLITTLQVFLLRAIDQPIAVQLAGVASTTVTLNPGGVLLVLDCTQAGDRAVNSNTATNTGPATGELTGVALGTV